MIFSFFFFFASFSCNMACTLIIFYGFECFYLWCKHDASATSLVFKPQTYLFRTFSPSMERVFFSFCCCCCCFLQFLLVYNTKIVWLISNDSIISHSTEKRFPLKIHELFSIMKVFIVRQTAWYTNKHGIFTSNMIFNNNNIYMGLVTIDKIQFSYGKIFVKHPKHIQLFPHC